MLMRLLGALVFGIIAAVFNGRAKQGKDNWSGPCTIVAAICGIGFALWAIVYNVGGGEMAERRAAEMKFQNIQAQVLGEKIAEKYPNGKVAILITGGASVNEQALIENLKKGLGSVQVVKEIAPKAAGQRPGMPMDMMFTSKELDAELKSAGNIDLLVCIAGLPMDMKVNKKGKITSPAQLGKIKIAGLGYPVRGNVRPQVLMKGDSIFGYTSNKKGYVNDGKVPSNKQEAFDKHYVFITPDNFESLGQM